MPGVTALTRIVVLLVLVAATNKITANWTRRRLAGAVWLGAVGGLFADTGASQSTLPWIASAATIGALLVVAYVLVLCRDTCVVPFGIATMTTAGTLREGWLQAYPGALGGAIVAVVAMWAAAYWLFLALNAPRAGKTVEPPP
jgi:hypothetical protein